MNSKDDIVFRGLGYLKRMSFTIKQMKNIVQCTLWAISLFSYYFQAPYSALSSLIIPMLAAYLLLDIKKMKKWDSIIIKAYFLFLTYLLVSGLLSAVSGTELNRIIRFFLILSIIPVCFFYKKNDFKNEYVIFKVLTVAKAVFLIIIAIDMVYTGTFDEYRTWAKEGGFGDIYILYGFMPRVQLLGNALLLLAFIVDFETNKKITIANAIIFAGVIIAGNLAFMLGLSIYILYKLCREIIKRRSPVFKIVAIVVTAGAIIGSLNYVEAEVERKSGGGGSIAYRIRQIQVLTDTNPFFGQGIGANVYGGDRIGRDSDAKYFELQTLYIYYQIGLFGLAVFYFITLSLCLKYKKRIFLLYLLYLFYSFFNPYCFDTTNMFAIILLINLDNGKAGINESASDFNSVHGIPLYHS